MAYSLDFHPEAEAEFDGALYWFKEQRDGLEQEFFEDYLAVEHRIADTPHQFPTVLDHIRRANFPRFPYSIFFEIRQNSIFIFSIFHQSRNPGALKNRL